MNSKIKIYFTLCTCSFSKITFYLHYSQVVFLQGVSPSLRKEVWPFLLGLYTFHSTAGERDAIRAKRRDEYWALDKRRYV